MLLRHLRYFLYPVPGFVEWFRDVGIWAGYVLAATALGLLIRRLVSAREAYVSILADYVALGLLLVIAGTGLLVHYHARMDLVRLKDFLLHAVSFRFEDPPAEFGGWVTVHIVAVLALTAYFPYSKLMHGIGLVFSPTRNQPNDPRRRRYVNPWNEQVEV